MDPSEKVPLTELRLLLVLGLFLDALVQYLFFDYLRPLIAAGFCAAVLYFPYSRALAERSAKAAGSVFVVIAAAVLVWGNLPSVIYPKFEERPQFVRLDRDAEYAVNGSSTIIHIGGSYYLWYEGKWYRSATVAGAYCETREVPAALVR